MTAHQAVLAFPITANADQTQARKLNVLRMPYVVTAASEVPSLVAVDPNTGDIIRVIMSLGRAYLFDATDTTSVHDGVTVLVSQDGKRYKLAANTDVVVYAVINTTTATPPGSPTLGDKYLVAASPTGAWSGHAGQVAVWTARGWEFVTVQVGQIIYDRSADSYLHKNTGGTMVLGLGTQVLPANSVKVSSLINMPVRWIIENQTTITPPAATVGIAYIVGAGATGAWSFHSKEIAVCEVAGAWSFYTPRVGERAFDKGTSTEVRWNGTTWIFDNLIVNSAGGSLTVSGGTTSGGSGSYANNDSIGPTTALAYIEDTIQLTYAAKKTNARLRFNYVANRNITGAITYALFRDAEANAIDWLVLDSVATSKVSDQVRFEINSNDALSHTYKVRIVNTGTALVAQTRRRFSVEEFG